VVVTVLIVRIGGERDERIFDGRHPKPHGRR
jgi:hypothetical protein